MTSKLEEVLRKRAPKQMVDLMITTHELSKRFPKDMYGDKNRQK